MGTRTGSKRVGALSSVESVEGSAGKESMGGGPRSCVGYNMGGGSRGMRSLVIRQWNCLISWLNSVDMSESGTQEFSSGVRLSGRRGVTDSTKSLPISKL